MGKQENAVTKTVQDYAHLLGVRLFRNNVGLFDTKGGGKIRTGLCVGSSDLIGWKSVRITPDMVGSTIAVFTALEVKTAKGKATDAQNAFIDGIREAGGIAGVVRGADDVEKLLAGAADM